jgi:hypothetical protein
MGELKKNTKKQKREKERTRKEKREEWFETANIKDK